MVSNPTQRALLPRSTRAVRRGGTRAAGLSASRLRDRAVVTQLRGPADLERNHLRASMLRHVDQERYLHVVDLGSIDAVAPSHLSNLITALRALRERGGVMHLVTTSPAVRRVLAVTGLDRVFRVFASVDDAMVALQ